MEQQDFPIRHFENMSQLARSLKDLPAEVLEHQYSNQSFGSWMMTIRYKGHVLPVRFDGRESEYAIETSSTRNPPHSWSVIWHNGADRDGDNFSGTITDAIRNASLR